MTLVGLGVVVGSLAGGGAPCPEPATPHADAIDRLLSGYARPDAPGAAVAVLVRGRLVFARGYGAARLEGPVLVGCRTAFRLASITKQMTAKAVALLVDEGRLALDTPIGDLLPGLPAWGDEVRVGHLLAHTSGVPDYEPLIPDSQTTQVTDRDAVRLAATRPALAFEPGTRFAYSNTGYAMLATIVEEVSGLSFTEFLDRRVFGPLGMDAVAHVEKTTVVPERAYGYRETDDGGFVDADQSVTSAVLGDGGVYASILDLARWDAALYRPGYPPDPARLGAYGAPPDDAVAYGFGWYLDTFDGHARQRHDGWTSGFRNEIQRFPDDGLTVVILTNRAAPSPRPIVEDIARLFLGDPGGSA